MKKGAFLTLFTLLVSVTAVSGQFFSAYDLKCDWQTNPLAINSTVPRFSWKSASEYRGFVQGGYELIVSDSEKAVNLDRGNMWHVRCDGDTNSLHVPYEGRELTNGATYWWKVRIVDGCGNVSPWSSAQSFTVGLLERDDWEGAEWIALEIMPEKERFVPGIEFNREDKWDLLGDRQPGKNKLPQFRKQINVRKTVEKATAYVSGIGHFVLFINGNKVGNNFLDPAWSDYDKYVYYVPFDITRQLTQGENTIGIMLGNGFASIPGERYFKMLASYCYPKTIIKIEVRYTDQTFDTFVSDSTWRTTESPVIYSSIFGGEDYDATCFYEGWMSNGYDDSGWQSALAAPHHTRLIAQNTLPVQIMQQFPPPVSVRKTRHGKWIYDLGQNFSGTVQITVRGVPGQKIHLNTCELFDPTIDSITIHGGYRGEYSLNYTIGSYSAEKWHPQFTYHGFRYVLMDGAVPAGEENPAGLPVMEDIRGLHVRNSTRTAGGFECSNDLLNKTFDLINWGIKSNMTHYFTDCPHREKLPWIEQLHLMFGSLHYNFDLYNLYVKMMEDMSLAQWDNGLIPNIAPMYMLFEDGFLDSPEWGSAFILAPWRIYEYYGDPSLLFQYYPRMKAYMDYLATKADDHIISHGLGDWCDLGPNYPREAQLTSLAATATPIYYMDAVTMMKIARNVGKTNDADRWEKLAADIRKSYNTSFYNADGGFYDRNSQTANAIALYAGLVESQNEKMVFDNLVKDIRTRGDALTGGDIGYNYILRTLEKYGASDVIYDMNSRYDVYGYGYMLAQGATALPESWQALPRKSHNHFMMGHLMEWLYTHVGGIRKGEDDTAYRHIVIKPEPVGDLTFANTWFETPCGMVSNRWKEMPDGFEMNISIPANTRATVWVPAQDTDYITESGVPASEAPGMKFLHYSEGYAVYETGGGSYLIRTFRK